MYFWYAVGLFSLFTVRCWSFGLDNLDRSTLGTSSCSLTRDAREACLTSPLRKRSDSGQDEYGLPDEWDYSPYIHPTHLLNPNAQPYHPQHPSGQSSAKPENAETKHFSGVRNPPGTGKRRMHIAERRAGGTVTYLAKHIMKKISQRQQKGGVDSESTGSDASV